MNPINDGGPAFPNTYIVGINGALHDAGSVGGMSLLDYFAAKALPKAMEIVASVHTPPHATYQATAFLSYEIAEEMVKESKRRKSRGGAS